MKATTKQTAVEWYAVQAMQLEIQRGKGIITISQMLNELSNILEQAKAMEKEQIKDAFVQCWKANVPDVIECKLDAEQYYTETYESNT
jgi:HEPN domain-containing protein